MILMIGCCRALAIFSSTISKSPILPIFAKSLGATGIQIGWIASASTIPGILISYLAGDLADRFGYKKILIGSLLIFASALAADVAHEGQLGASLGIMSTLMDVGQTFGSPVIGGISDIYSYSVGIWVLAIIFLIAAIECIIALINQHRTKQMA